MTLSSIALLATYLGAVVALGYPLGLYMARVYDGTSPVLRGLAPFERLFYRAAGVREDEDMPWSRYALAVLVFNVLGVVVVYALQRLQGSLALNPDGLGAVSPEVSFNTAVSFASNTNWQAYGGETTLSYLTQMVGLTVQNFVSAATGMAVLIALVRGMTRKNAIGIGSFWVDLVRTTLYVLLPLSFVLAIVLVSQGVVQTLAPHATAHLLDATTRTDGSVIVDQLLALGPAASQVAIKQLGTNGGGFFNVNSAHPFENPTPLSNFLECASILLLPAALCFTFGELVKDRRQGWAVLASMLAIFIPLAILAIGVESAGNPLLTSLDVDQVATALSGGGNMEGKEVRFGPAESAIWAVSTTAASNGSVNAMHDSFMPLGGLAPMWLMQLGEIIFGGVGSGLYGMIVYAIIAVFIAGLMVGRTPEYLGKKIESYEMKMASLVILLPSAAVLLGTAIASATDVGTATLGNPGIHGFSEILYAFSSGANNNGSAFGGITVSGTFYATAIGICMWIGRYWVIVPVLAIAGSLARKKSIPASVGTLPTHDPLFVALLVSTIVLVGALTFIPALALGPIVEHLELGALVASH
ncbi:MAG: potassium-transporting ATPase subunit KdpA [Deltaproteobacteria bacterium]|nr:potassium-transporting ATPase subunit KdpA [Deltaproteobacteria bacterium]